MQIIVESENKLFIESPIWNHQPLLDTYKANLFIIHSREKISLDKKSLEIQAKSCDFILIPDNSPLSFKQ